MRMKLTSASSYALHAVTLMAAMKNNEAFASHNIAHARGISERFLLKVLKPLVECQILISVKGPNGGYRLAKAPTDITLLEIIEAVDRGLIRGGVPPVRLQDNQPLNNKLEAVCVECADAVRKTLQAVKLSDLVGKKDKELAAAAIEKAAAVAAARSADRAAAKAAAEKAAVETAAKTAKAEKAAKRKTAKV